MFFLYNLKYLLHSFTILVASEFLLVILFSWKSVTVVRRTSTKPCIFSYWRLCSGRIFYDIRQRSLRSVRTAVDSVAAAELSFKNNLLFSLHSIFPTEVGLTYGRVCRFFRLYANPERVRCFRSFSRTFINSYPIKSIEHPFYYERENGWFWEFWILWFFGFIEYDDSARFDCSRSSCSLCINFFIFS